MDDVYKEVFVVERRYDGFSSSEEDCFLEDLDGAIKRMIDITHTKKYDAIYLFRIARNGAKEMIASYDGEEEEDEEV